MSPSYENQYESSYPSRTMDELITPNSTNREENSISARFKELTMYDEAEFREWRRRKEIEMHEKLRREFMVMEDTPQTRRIMDERVRQEEDRLRRMTEFKRRTMGEWRDPSGEYRGRVSPTYRGKEVHQAVFDDPWDALDHSFNPDPPKPKESFDFMEELRKL